MYLDWSRVYLKRHSFLEEVKVYAYGKPDDDPSCRIVVWTPCELRCANALHACVRSCAGCAAAALPILDGFEFMFSTLTGVRIQNLTKNG
jgi:hypothetical protein